jgi:NAD(P)-dependent dehydrogenase (short-subunit alcohol dehydrogenase family)
VVYLALNGAIDSLTRNLAWELGARRITVNAVAPGFTETPMAAPYLADPAIRAWVSTLNALGGTGAPEDVANVIAFLASEEGRWITGQVIDVSGGLGAGSSSALGLNFTGAVLQPGGTCELEARSPTWVRRLMKSGGRASTI